MRVDHDTNGTAPRPLPQLAMRPEAAGAEPAPALPPLLLTAAEAAKALSISPRTLFSLTARGDVRAVRPLPHIVRYDPRDLAAYLERLRTGPPPPPLPKRPPRKKRGAALPPPATTRNGTH